MSSSRNIYLYNDKNNFWTNSSFKNKQKKGHTKETQYLILTNLMTVPEHIY